MRTNGKSGIGSRARLALPFLFLCLALLQAGPARAFTVGYFLFEPHAMVQNGQPAGAAVDYFRDYIAPEMGLDVEFVGPVPFARLLENFREGEYDAVLLLAKNRVREGQYVYPAEPFGEMQSALLVNVKQLPDNVTSPESLRGMVIGYTEKAWRPPLMRRPWLKFDMVISTSATIINFRKFDQGRIDAVYSPDKNALLYRKNRVRIRRPCKVVTIDGTDVGFYTVFHLGVDPAIVRVYEKALEKVRRKTPYSALVEKYLAPQTDRNELQQLILPQ